MNQNKMYDIFFKKMNKTNGRTQLKKINDDNNLKTEGVHVTLHYISITTCQLSTLYHLFSSCGYPRRRQIDDQTKTQANMLILRPGQS
jgi:hypothetical protein